MSTFGEAIDWMAKDDSHMSEMSGHVLRLRLPAIQVLVCDEWLPISLGTPWIQGNFTLFKEEL